MQDSASLILANARVLTMDPGNPRAEAVAVGGQRILAVGSLTDALQYRTSHTEVIDCQGLPLIPGINDAHCHVLATAASLSGVDCGPGAVTSLDKLLAAVTARAAELPPGRWIRGFGLDASALKESRYPTRWELDSAAPRHPVRLDHASGHAALLNSRGLEVAGIGSDTPDPLEGIIDRDPATGQPTGLLLEMAGYLRAKLGNTRSPAELAWDVRRLSDKLLSYGITSVQDAGPYNGMVQWETFQSLVCGKAFRPRITMMAGSGKLDEFAGAGLGFASGDERLRLGHAKIMLTLTTGDLHPAPDDLEQVAAGALARGFPFAVHAVEQEALAAVLDLPQLGQAPHVSLGRDTDSPWPLPVPRNRIEHCSECPPPLMDRLARANVPVVTQPGFVYWRGDNYLRNVDRGLLPYLYPVDELSRRGIGLAFSSDSPLIDPSPWAAIYGAVARRTFGGEDLPEGYCIRGSDDMEDARMDIRRALAAYTLSGATVEGADHVKGAIRPGMLADLALIECPLDGDDVERLKDARARLTILGGEVVWDGKAH